MSHQSFSPRPDVTLGYNKTDGVAPSLPGVIFLSGYMSDMTGAKATYLEDACRAHAANLMCGLTIAAAQPPAAGLKISASPTGRRTPWMCWIH